MPLPQQIQTSATRFQTLVEWLRWQETLHPNRIDLGLERVREVARRMQLLGPAHAVITVGGTNGKGSAVAMLDAILRAAGYRVGSYLSPHVLRYNERVRINGVDVADADLCAAFARVNAARGDISLTYFEFGTLAALDLFAHAGLDVVMLEVGLGGRLDAVNILDADAALLTSIGIDHVEWLGADRESIGFEKAGIFRAGRPAICAEPTPPASVARQAQTIGAAWLLRGRDFDFTAGDSDWAWRAGDSHWQSLPFPALAGGHQLDNAAGALMVLHSLRERLSVTAAAVAQGLITAALPGRMQRRAGAVECILDVAHNPHAAGALAAALRESPPSGRTLTVLALLADKDAVGIAQALAPVTDAWYLAGLTGPRGRSGAELVQALAGWLTGDVVVFESVATAYAEALAAANAGDRVLVCGSFHTVGEVLAAWPETGPSTDD